MRDARIDRVIKPAPTFVLTSTPAHLTKRNTMRHIVRDPLISPHRRHCVNTPAPPWRRALGASQRHHTAARAPPRQRPDRQQRVVGGTPAGAPQLGDSPWTCPACQRKSASGAGRCRQPPSQPRGTGIHGVVVAGVEQVAAPPPPEEQVSSDGRRAGTRQEQVEVSSRRTCCTSPPRPPDSRRRSHPG